MHMHEVMVYSNYYNIIILHERASALSYYKITFVRPSVCPSVCPSREFSGNGLDPETQAVVALSVEH